MNRFKQKINTMNKLKKILTNLDDVNPKSYRVSMLLKELKETLKEINIESITYTNK